MFIVDLEECLLDRHGAVRPGVARALAGRRVAVRTKMPPAVVARAMDRLRRGYGVRPFRIVEGSPVAADTIEALRGHSVSPQDHLIGVSGDTRTLRDYREAGILAFAPAMLEGREAEALAAGT